MYLNVSFNYLSNINSKFVMRFDYHDNFFNRMRIFFISKRMRNLNHSFEIKKNLFVPEKYINK